MMIKNTYASDFKKYYKKELINQKKKNCEYFIGNSRFLSNAEKNKE